MTIKNISSILGQMILLGVGFGVLVFWAEIGQEVLGK